VLYKRLNNLSPGSFTPVLYNDASTGLTLRAMLGVCGDDDWGRGLRGWLWKAVGQVVGRAVDGE
jgi:hypothetical protein